MTEAERQKERFRQEEMDAKLYYDYERGFVWRKLDKERMNILPRVIKPPMFAKGGHALGDARVFEQLAVGPVPTLTCSFLDVAAGDRTELQRMIPSTIAYVLEGSGECIQEGKSYRFSAEDVVVIPPYTKYQFVAADEGFRAWVPEVRLWHVMGLLWQEQFEFKGVPEGTEPIRDGSGHTVGFRVPRGVLDLERDLEIRGGANAKREEIFNARRAIRQVPPGETKYDHFLREVVRVNELTDNGPRVLRGADVPWEHTRQGRLKFYISHWTRVAAAAMDLMVQEIEPGGHSGRHRHLFQELLLVLKGKGHDEHEKTRYPWEAGDLICIPPVTEHQHFNDGPGAARLVSVWSRQLAHQYLGGIEHIGDASNWKR